MEFSWWIVRGDEDAKAGVLGSWPKVLWAEGPRRRCPIWGSSKLSSGQWTTKRPRARVVGLVAA